MSDALSKVINGGKIPDNKLKGALGEAVDKVKSLGGRIGRVKEMAENAADAVITTAEIQGANFGGCFAEGYFGEEKMDVGPVDVRLVGGLLTSGYGLYKTMTGKGGEHALAIGNGVMASAIGRVARNAGKALAEKGAGKTPGAATAAIPAAGASAAAGAAAVNAPPALANPGPNAGEDFAGLVRNIMLTPEAGANSASQGGRHKPSRFIEVVAR